MNRAARGEAAEPRDRLADGRAGNARDAEKAREKLFAAALKVLAARPRSENQLRERLLARPWAEPDMVDDCIARLRELGYVNDQTFAESYASSRVRLKAMGRSRVARELANKKVARETINNALDGVFDEVGEESLIEKAIEKRIRTHGAPTDRAGARRLFDHLVRLGFEYDLIMRKLRALRAGIDEQS